MHYVCRLLIKKFKTIAIVSYWMIFCSTSSELSEYLNWSVQSIYRETTRKIASGSTGM